MFLTIYRPLYSLLLKAQRQLVDPAAIEQAQQGNDDDGEAASSGRGPSSSE